MEFKRSTSSMKSPSFSAARRGLPPPAPSPATRSSMSRQSFTHNNASTHVISSAAGPIPTATTTTPTSTKKTPTPTKQNSFHSNNNNNSITEDSVTELHIAAKRGDIQRIEFLLRNFKKSYQQNAQQLRSPSTTPSRSSASQRGSTALSFSGFVNAVDANQQTPLHYAVIYGKAAAVTTLITQAKANVHSKDKDGKTPLHKACQLGRKACVIALLKGGAQLTCVDNSGWNPLHEAACRGHTACLEVLLNNAQQQVRQQQLLQQVEINRRSSATHNGEPQHHSGSSAAAISGKFLLVNSTTNHGSTPAHLAARCGFIDVLKLLASYNADMNCRDEWRETPLHWAVYNGHTDVVSFLLSINVEVNLTSSLGLTPLHLSCRYGRTQCARVLIEQGGADIECKTLTGATPLHECCARGTSKDCLTALLNYGAKIDAVDNDGRTPLHYAAFGGHLHCIHAIFDFVANGKYTQPTTTIMSSSTPSTPKAEPMAKTPTIPKYTTPRPPWTPTTPSSSINTPRRKVDFTIESPSTPSHTRIDTDVQDYQRVLPPIPSLSHLINFETSDGWLPLHEAAVGGHVQCIELFIVKGADVNARTKKGSTPLHFAARNQKHDCVNFLITVAAADINAKDEWGETALHWAAFSGDVDMCNLLIRKGANAKLASEKGITPAHLACRYNNLRCLTECFFAETNGHEQPAVVNTRKFFLKNINTLLTSNGWTLLHEAANKGHAQIVEFLLSKGANPLSLDKQRKTPIHRAAFRSHADCLKLLLNRAIELHSSNSGNTAEDDIMVDEDGWTPVHEACASGSNECLTLLIETMHSRLSSFASDTKRLQEFVNKDILFSACNVNRATLKGSTPLHFAVRFGHTNCVETLLRYSNSTSLPSEISGLLDRLSSEISSADATEKHMISSLLDNIRHHLLCTIDSEDRTRATPLHWACFHGQPDCARLLLKSGAQVNRPDIDGSTPLHKAANQAQLECMALLFEYGADLLSRGHDGWTPIHEAASQGNAKAIGLLLDEAERLMDVDPNHPGLPGRGIQYDREQLANYINCPTEKKSTPLHLCARAGLSETMLFLTRFVTKKTMAASTDTSSSKLEAPTTRLLPLDLEAVDAWGQSALHWACFNGHAKCVGILLDKGHRVDLPDSSEQATPLHKACKMGHSSCVKKFFEKTAKTLQDRSVIDAKDFKGRTPLHLSASNGHLECVFLLVEHNAGIKEQCKMGHIPLHKAILGRHIETVEYLLQRHNKHLDGDPSTRESVLVNFFDGNGLNAFHILCKYDKVTSSITGSTHVNSDDHDVEQQKHVALLKFLVAKQQQQQQPDQQCKYIDLPSRNSERYPPLFYAIMNGSFPLVQALVEECGAESSITYKTPSNITILSVCAKYGRTKILQYILHWFHSGPSVDAVQKRALLLHEYLNLHDTEANLTPLMHAISSNNPACSKLLIKASMTRIFQTDHDSDHQVKNLIHFAIQQNSFESLKLVIDAVIEDNPAGAKSQIAKLLNEPDSATGLTSMHHGVASGNIKMLDFLLQHGANVNSPASDTQFGRTPIHHLCSTASVTAPHVLQYLMKHGANLMAQDQNGRNCLHLLAAANINSAEQLSILGAPQAATTATATSEQLRAALAESATLLCGFDKQCKLQREQLLRIAPSLVDNKQLCAVPLLYSTDANGDTPLHKCVKENNLVCFQVLFDHVLTEVSGKKDIEEIESVLMQTNPLTSDNIIHTACEFGHPAVIEALESMVSNSSDLALRQTVRNLVINAKNATGETALAKACKAGKLDCVEQLLKFYDTDDENEACGTIRAIQEAILVSVRHNHTDLLKPLLHRTIQLQLSRIRRAETTATSNPATHLGEAIRGAFTVSANDEAHSSEQPQQQSSLLEQVICKIGYNTDGMSDTQNLSASKAFLRYILSPEFANQTATAVAAMRDLSSDTYHVAESFQENLENVLFWLLFEQKNRDNQNCFEVAKNLERMHQDDAVDSYDRESLTEIMIGFFNNIKDRLHCFDSQNNKPNASEGIAGHTERSTDEQVHSPELPPKEGDDQLVGIDDLANFHDVPQNEGVEEIQTPPIVVPVEAQSEEAMPPDNGMSQPSEHPATEEPQIEQETTEPIVTESAETTDETVPVVVAEQQEPPLGNGEAAVPTEDHTPELDERTLEDNAESETGDEAAMEPIVLHTDVPQDKQPVQDDISTLDLDQPTVMTEEQQQHEPQPMQEDTQNEEREANNNEQQDVHHEENNEVQQQQQQPKPVPEPVEQDDALFPPQPQPESQPELQTQLDEEQPQYTPPVQEERTLEQITVEAQQSDEQYDDNGEHLEIESEEEEEEQEGTADPQPVDTGGEVQQQPKKRTRKRVSGIVANSPLHKAVIARQIDLVRVLVQQAGTNINAKDRDGNTPLMLAARQCDTEMAQILISNGCDITIRNNKGSSCLHEALKTHNKRVTNSDPTLQTDTPNDCIRLLLDHNSRQAAESLEAMKTAAGSAEGQFTNLLLERDDEGRTPFHSAADKPNCNTSLLKYMLHEAIKIKLDQVKFDALKASRQQGEIDDDEGEEDEIDAVALEFRAHQLLGDILNDEDNNGDSVINLIIRNGGSDLVKYLTEGQFRFIQQKQQQEEQAPSAASLGLCRVEKLARRSKRNGRTALHEAADGGHANLLQMLLEKYKQAHEEPHHDDDEDEAISLDMRDVAFGRTALHLAAERENIRCVELLLRYGADVNATDRAQNTPLHIAASNNTTDTVLLTLLQSGAQVNLPNAKMRTPLHEACSKDRLACASLLLQQGANVEAVDSDLCTPLHLAVYYNALQCVGLLLNNANVNINKREKNGWAPFHICAALGNVHSLRMLVGLQQQDPNVLTSKGNSALHLAAKFGHTECIAVLLQNGCNINIKSVNEQLTPLHLAAIHERPASIEILVKNGANVNEGDRMGNTPLHYATAHSKLRSIIALLENNANVNAVNTEGNTCLHVAASQGNATSMKAILDYFRTYNSQGIASSLHANLIPNLHILNCNGYAPIHACAEYDSSNSGDAISENTSGNSYSDSDSNDRLTDTNNGFNTWQYRAHVDGNIECVKLLCQFYDDFAAPLLNAPKKTTEKYIEFLNAEKLTLLHLACYSGRTNLVKYLLGDTVVASSSESGSGPANNAARAYATLTQPIANLNARDAEGATPLHYCVSGEQLECGKALLKNNIAANLIRRSTTSSGLHPAIMKNLLVDINAANATEGATALHFASITGQNEFVELLLDCGANVDSENLDKTTPLHLAAREGNIQVLNTLINRGGARIDPRSADGYTPLHEACQYARKDCVLALLQYGANLLAKSHQGHSCLQLAVTAQHTDIIEILLSRGASTELEDLQGNSVVHLCASGGLVDSLLCLQRLGVRLDPKNRVNQSPFHIACMAGHIDILRILEDYAVAGSNNNNNSNNVDNQQLQQRQQQPTELSYNNISNNNSNNNDAIMDADVAAAQRRKLLFNEQDNYGFSPLYHACVYGREVIVEYLLKKGASVLLVDTAEGNTPLLNSVIYGQEKSVRILVDFIEAHPDIYKSNHYSNQQQQQHVQGSSTTTTTTTTGASLRSRIWKKASAATAAADNQQTLNHDDDADMSEKATNAMIWECVMKKNKFGQNPLHAACRFGHYNITKFFLELGARLGIITTLNATTATVTTSTSDNNNKNTSINQYNEGGGGTRSKGFSLSSLLSRTNSNGNNNNNNSDAVGAKPAPAFFNDILNVTDNNGTTYLQYASSNGHADVVKLLLDYCASPLVQDLQGSSPLHMACLAGHEQCVSVLAPFPVALSPPPPLPNDNSSNNSSTAKTTSEDAMLSPSYSSASVAVISMMLNLRDAAGKRPIDLAIQNGKSRIVQYLDQLEKICASANRSK